MGAPAKAVYFCRRLKCSFTDPETCKKRKERAGKQRHTFGEVTAGLVPCLGCTDKLVVLEGSMPAEQKPPQGGQRTPQREKKAPENGQGPHCKNHPDRPAKLTRKGINTGLCWECLIARAKKAGKSQNKNKKDSLDPQTTPSPKPDPAPALAPCGSPAETGAGDDPPVPGPGVEAVDGNLPRAGVEIEKGDLVTMDDRGYVFPARKAPRLDSEEQYHLTISVLNGSFAARTLELRALGRLLRREVDNFEKASNELKLDRMRISGGVMARLLCELGRAGAIPGWEEV